MNVFIHELKTYIKSTAVWIFSLSILTILMLLMFPGFSKDISGIKQILSGYPEAVKKALNVSIDKFASITGFYSYIFLYVLLLGAVQAMNLGLSLLSRETENKTSDFLLTKPISRESILTSKLLSAFFLLVITNIIYSSVSCIMAYSLNDNSFNLSLFLMISVTLFFVQLIFTALGVLISVLFRIKSVVSASLSIVFSTFLINMLHSVFGGSILRYLTPFKYFDTDYIIKNAAYEPSFIIAEIIFISASIAASYILYSKKDIHAV